MRILALGTAVALASVVVSTSVFAQCMIFEKANYEGGQGTIQPNDLVKFFDEEVQFSGVPADARIFTDTSWRDNIGSVKLTNGCQMITYDEPKASSKHRRYLQDSASMIANMNTEVATSAAAAHCSCQ